MTVRGAEQPAIRRAGMSDFATGLCVVLAVPLAIIVEWLAATMIRGGAHGGQFAVLGLFAVPLVTGWGAIALNLSTKPMSVRLAVAAVLVVAPPVLLFGAFNG